MPPRRARGQRNGLGGVGRGWPCRPPHAWGGRGQGGSRGCSWCCGVLSWGFERVQEGSPALLPPAPLSLHLLVCWMATGMADWWQWGLLKSCAPASCEASSMRFVLSPCPPLGLQSHKAMQSQAHILPQGCNDFILFILPPMLWPHTPLNLRKALSSSRSQGICLEPLALLHLVHINPSQHNSATYRQIPRPRPNTPCPPPVGNVLSGSLLPTE